MKELEMEDPQERADCETSEGDPRDRTSLRTDELVRLKGIFVRYIPFKRDVEESGKILDRIVFFCVI